MENNLTGLLKQTEELIKQEKEQEALELLKTELKNPLYSLKEQAELKEKIRALETFLKQNE